MQSARIDDLIAQPKKIGWHFLALPIYKKALIEKKNCFYLLKQMVYG